MPQVSKYPISEDVYIRILEVFSKSIIELKNDNQVWNFFKEFLTPTEQIMLSKRFAVAFLLAKNYTYRDISKILRVSTTTISHVAFSYKYGSDFKRMVRIILKDESISEFWEKIGEKILILLASPGRKSNSWVYLREEVRKRNLSKPF